MPLHSLAKSAAEVLRLNDRGKYTIPSPRLYPHQWAWDSAFAALGWSWLDMDRALLELETLLQGQWPDGRVPHIYFHHQDPSYFPGPEMWETPYSSSSITQPPVWASVTRKLYERGADPQRIKAILPALEASHRFFQEQRDPLGWNLVAIAHPWESGQDNSPAWDLPLQAIDPSQAPEFKRVDKERVDDVDQRPTDEDYQRYIYLVKNLAHHDFQITEWAVYDPFMTSLLIQAELDLQVLAEAFQFDSQAAQRADAMKAGLIKHLWSEDEARFGFYDVFGEQFYTPDVISSYFPLILDLPDAYKGPLFKQINQKYLTPYPLPTTSPQDAAFNLKRYWRGPVWININWLMAPTLGESLKQKSLMLLEKSGFAEYFHPETGEGLGGTEFTWSAALALEWLNSP